MSFPSSGRSRWLALAVVSLGVLMVVLDMTVVNVALPSIRADLGFSETTLVWVVNGYALTCGGFLLLGGRHGDLYGQRRLFMIGITVFSLASLACGRASAQVPLVIARAIQGLGGAVVDAVSLALLMASACCSVAPSPRPTTGTGSFSSTCRSVRRCSR